MLPLVTVITPCSRPHMLQRAKEVFISQCYPNKELLIAMDIDRTADTDMENRIYQWKCTGSIATKRNNLCSHARGEIIAHLDDDDWVASDWLTKLVAHMVKTGADTTGINHAWFYKPHSQLWQYRWQGKQPYVVGGTLAYKKKIWERNPFRETATGVGEDTIFMRAAGRVIPHDYHNGFVAMIHDNNTTSHNGVRTNPRFHPHHPDYMRKVLGVDYDKYPILAKSS